MLTVIMSNNIISYQRNLVNNHPCAAEVNENIAIKATTKIKIPCQTLLTPMSSNSGLKIKTIGSMAVRIS